MLHVLQPNCVCVSLSLGFVKKLQILQHCVHWTNIDMVMGYAIFIKEHMQFSVVLSGPDDPELLGIVLRNRNYKCF